MEPRREIDTGGERLRVFLVEQDGTQLPPRIRTQMQELVTRLPKITETELRDMGHSESVCPICFNTFLAIIAEEEMALVMESPAHPVEELGLTRLHETCGHLFCRRELSPRSIFHLSDVTDTEVSITKWINGGRDSCPTCRRPFLTIDDHHHAEQDSPSDGSDGDFSWIIQEHSDITSVEFSNAGLLPVLAVPSEAMGGNSSANRPQSRDHFSGMYS